VAVAARLALPAAAATGLPPRGGSGGFPFISPSAGDGHNTATDTYKP